MKSHIAKILTGLAALTAAGLTGQAQYTYASPKRNMKTKSRSMKVNPLRRLARHLPGILPWLAALPCAALDQANYATPYTFTTLAGGFGIGSADGTGSSAWFFFPHGVAVDGAGNLYVGGGNSPVIRKGLPAGSVPAPILEPPSLAAGQFSFAITGLPNLAVNLESSGDLSQWLLVGTYILEGGTNSFAGPKPPEGAQFYRAHVR